MIRSRRPWRRFELPLVSNSLLKILRAKVRRITRLLERRYGVPSKKRKRDLIEILIQTILSQNTNDRNRNRAYQGLKTQFPSWEDVLRARARTVIQAIRPGGLAEQKAGRIHEILHWIKEREGRLSLSFLKKMDADDVEKTIGGLKGIGPKTVHCLLLFGMGREAFPVDTHILRTGKRFGLIPERMSAEKAHQWMIPLIPNKKSLSLHLNLIRFGREICRGKNPRCEICFLSKECIFSYHKQFPNHPSALTGESVGEGQPTPVEGHRFNYVAINKQNCKFDNTLKI